jgi:hypothetical protein
MDHGKDIKWAVTVMSSHDISRGMLRRSPYNLYVDARLIGQDWMTDVGGVGMRRVMMLLWSSSGGCWRGDMKLLR